MSNLAGEVVHLLNELTGIQDEILTVLVQKRKAMAGKSVTEIQSLQTKEEELFERLKGCHDRRGDILKKAEEEGVPAKSLRELVHDQSKSNGQGLTECQRKLQESAEKFQEIRLENLSNWVVAQRSLLHVSQMIDIIALGGKIRPTYGNSSYGSSGGLLDQQG